MEDRTESCEEECRVKEMPFNLNKFKMILKITINLLFANFNSLKTLGMCESLF